MFSKSMIVVVAGSALALACGRKASGPSAQTMSAAEHDRAARVEIAKAQTLSAEYDPTARTTERACPDVLGGPACWSSTTNPTKENLERAEEHRKRAAAHRAASQALRDAEARACAGLAEQDRDVSPFARREDIAEIRPIYTAVHGMPTGPGFESGPTRREQLAGALVTFRAVRGMTTQWLQRQVDCHLARAAAMGHDVPEMSYCPLVPKGVSATVRPAHAGFAIEIRSTDPEAAREVWRRAEALATASSGASDRRP